ncbi:MAG TPA: S8 family serine peptidase [Thermoanaerobaculia bacterium]|nr:S8 family serine peptidase [Thermoanaerobaculia bacterium]
MRRLILLIHSLAFLVASSLSAATTSVIVELPQEPAAVAADGGSISQAGIESYRASLRAEQNDFLAALAAKGVAFQVGGVTLQNAAGEEVRYHFAYTLVFNGINLLVDEGAIATIEAMPEVKAVHADEMLYTQLNASVAYIRAPEVYGAIHELTATDTANEGLEGQGVHISVIDTGIEWFHEQFGGDTTPPRLGVDPVNPDVPINGKVVYYLPFLQADVIVEDGFGHGTHVAATAAGYLGFAPGFDGVSGTADDVRVHGVAPQAKLLSYKVCSDVISTVSQVRPMGGCFSSAIIAALEDSVSPTTQNGFPKPVADVINMSLGGSGTPDSITAIASDNASRAGAVVVAAGGNSGPGEGTVGAPCVGRHVVCVANSIDPSAAWSTDVLDATSIDRSTTGAVTPASSFPYAEGQRRDITMFPMAGTTPPPGDGMAQYYVFVSGGELLANWPTSARGRIAIVQNSLPATFGQIANNGFLAGAVAVIFRSATANPTAVKAALPAANMPPADFDYLKTLINGTPNPPNGALSTYPIRINAFFANTSLNNSSSRGPVAGYGQVKPDVTAPGTNILAAVPPASLLGALSQGRYGSVSGTSMASPHVAGAAALLRQAHPGWNVDMIRTALQSTATNLRDGRQTIKADSTTGQRVLDQGAGLVDVFESVHSKAMMGVVSSDPKFPSILGSHSFGAVAAINSGTVISRSAAVVVRDVSGEGGTYDLAVVNNRNLELDGVTVTLSSTQVSVPAGGEASYDVTISIDGNIVTNAALAPLQIEWYVTASRSDGGESLRMPFYFRATAPGQGAPELTIGDDADPDQQDGVDRDGNYTLRWTYPADDLRPCGYRVEEATESAAQVLLSDDGSELLLAGSNSRWSGSAEWTNMLHPTTGTLGYSPLYTDNLDVSLQSAQAIELPAGARVILTFDSSEDIETDFDYGHVEGSADGGASWTTLATYTGVFAGERSVDLSIFAGSSTLVRFRFFTDGGVAAPDHRGWIIDNIRIVASAGFTTLATVGASTAHYDVTERSDGTYFYRVSSLFGDCAAPSAAVPSNVEQITVSRVLPPTASFTSSPNPSYAGDSVTFDASASVDNDDKGSGPAIVRYDWSFGDGATASSTTAVVSHTYTASGTYRVLLTITDNDGQSATAEATHQVSSTSAAISGSGWIPVTGGKGMFGLDITMVDTVASGTVRYHDQKLRLKLESTAITSVYRDAGTATIHGTCTINKVRTTSFTATAVDGSPDRFSITFDDYSASGDVEGGRITVQ